MLWLLLFLLLFLNDHPCVLFPPFTFKPKLFIRFVSLICIPQSYFNEHLSTAEHTFFVSLKLYHMCMLHWTCHPLLTPKFHCTCSPHSFPVLHCTCSPMLLPHILLLPLCSSSPLLSTELHAPCFFLLKYHAPINFILLWSWFLLLCCHNNTQHTFIYYSFIWLIRNLLFILQLHNIHNLSNILFIKYKIIIFILLNPL